MSPEDVLKVLLSESNLVMEITGLREDLWYRKPSGPRRGPWYSGEFQVTNDLLWRKKEECIYFLEDNSSVLRYVGLSVNRLADRWRSSPAYTEQLVPLNRNEIFHSQCWPSICEVYNNEGKSKYKVSVLHGRDLLKVLSGMEHPLSCFSQFKEDPEMAVIALEVWIIKRFCHQLWNKRK